MVSRALKNAIGKVLDRRGLAIVRKGSPASKARRDPRQPPPDLGDDLARLFERVRDYTMTTPERVGSLRDAVRYVVANGIPGAIVECGVWRGGSMMAVALTLKELGVADRDLWMYDTWTGMPEPGEEDVDIFGVSASRRQGQWQERLDAGAVVPTTLQQLSVDEVRSLLVATGYPEERMRFVGGLVEETIPGEAPSTIAILRLDTDYYASTRHELEHLYPRVSDGGVLIIDDYGRWQGARKAVDEYVAAHELHLLFHRTDAASRIATVRLGR